MEIHTSSFSIFLQCRVVVMISAGASLFLAPECSIRFKILWQFDSSPTALGIDKQELQRPTQIQIEI